jgi:hypothetical protein
MDHLQVPIENVLKTNHHESQPTQLLEILRGFFEVKFQ